MSYPDNVKALQAFAGTATDGIFGPKTAAALVEKLNLNSEADTAQSSNKLKVFLDPGHGMANRRAGVFDGGCERGELKEADIVLQWAKVLSAKLRALGVEVFFSRTDNKRPTPLGTRARLAENDDCDIFVSIHVNDAESLTATGTETFYMGEDDEPLARRCQAAMLKGIGLRDRGIKQSNTLTVLRFNKQAVLLELGFIGTDAAKITNPHVIEQTSEHLAQAIIGA